MSLKITISCLLILNLAACIKSVQPTQNNQDISNDIDNLKVSLILHSEQERI